MSDPVIIEIVIAAPADAVWRALRDPAEIKRWFGWDYEGAEDEVDEIFVRGATADENARTIDLGEGGRFELSEQGTRTIVTVTRAAPAGASGWDGIYDEVNEGWLTFLQQLRFMLERHPLGRRTALMVPLRGEEWFRTEHQVGVVVEGRLVISTPERVIVSAYG